LKIEILNYRLVADSRWRGNSDLLNILSAATIRAYTVSFDKLN